MDSPLVSIIIPVYKVEKYLRRCLESVRNQTYKNIEVILVDDGSPDGCPAICDEYAAKDKRFRVIHKENGGVSSARNAGLDEISAGGEYVGFVDSDDWLPRDAIDELLTSGKGEDFICGNYARVLISGSKYSKGLSDDSFRRCDSEKLSSCFGAVCTSWGKLFKNSIIKQYGIRFPNNMKINEDTYFVFDYISRCNTIATHSSLVYYYNHLSDASLTRRYYPDLNNYYKLGYYMKLKSYDPSHLPLIEQSRIMELFQVASEHYVYNLPREDAINKIAETHEMFEEYFKLVDDERIVGFDNPFVRQYIDYRDFLQKRDYAAIYDYILPHCLPTKKKKLKLFVRNTLLPIEQFLVFRLGLFYK